MTQLLNNYIGVGMQKYFSILAVGALAFVLSACGNKELALSDENKMSLAGKEVVLSKHEPSPFRSQTNGAAFMLGAFAEGIFYSNGRKIVNENNIKDPAIRISDLISQELAKRYEMKVSTKPADEYYEKEKSKFVSAVHSKKIAEEKLVGFYDYGDYILDVDTFFWGIQTINANDINYIADIRLIDRASQEAIAADRCVFSARKHSDKKVPYYSEIVKKNNAQVLKDYLSEASEYCAKNFAMKQL